MEKIMKISFHPDLIGKAERIGDKMYCQGQPVNMGRGWETVDLTWEEVFDLITVTGHATSAELSNDNRCDNSFVSRELLMVDVDGGMLLEELFYNDFYRAHGAGFYVTPSHTEQAHRFRILFRLEQPETDPVRTRKIILALMKIFQHSDPVCKDASRLFYGTPNCANSERKSTVLSVVMADALVEVADNLNLLAPVQAESPIPEVDWKTLEEAKVNNVNMVLTAIKNKIPNLDYGQWRSVAWAVAKELGREAGEVVMREYYPEQESGEYRNLYKSWNAGKSPTMGTLYHMAGIKNITEFEIDSEKTELENKMKRFKEKYNG